MKNKILFYCLISIVIVNVISLYLTMLPFYFEKSIFSQNFWQNHNQSFVSLSSISSETTTITHSLTSKTTKKFTLVSRTIQNAISCFALFNNDEVEQNRSLTDLQFRHNKSVIKYSLLECTDLLSGGRYVLWPTSPEEDDFSIAFSIVMYRDVEQFEKLLRSIYRPQNLICIHVDSKASENVWNSVNKIARCLNLQFKNIIVTNSRVHPTWGQYSVLEADLNCMRELHNARDRRKWRYLINLTGQEFPLRTHLELVRILSILNGANLLEAEPFDGRKRLRQTQKIPSGVHMYKGSLHIVVSARFVDFTLNDPRALRLLDYVRNATSVPDEWYFSTMNHNPASLPAPGAFLGAANGSFVQSDSPNLNWELPNRQYPFLNRIKAWKWGPMLCRLILNYWSSNLFFNTILLHVLRKYCKCKLYSYLDIEQVFSQQM